MNEFRRGQIRWAANPASHDAPVSAVTASAGGDRPRIQARPSLIHAKPHNPPPVAAKPIIASAISSTSGVTRLNRPKPLPSAPPHVEHLRPVWDRPMSPPPAVTTVRPPRPPVTAEVPPFVTPETAPRQPILNPVPETPAVPVTSTEPLQTMSSPAVKPDTAPKKARTRRPLRRSRVLMATGLLTFLLLASGATYLSFNHAKPPVAAANSAAPNVNYSLYLPNADSGFTSTKPTTRVQRGLTSTIYQASKGSTQITVTMRPLPLLADNTFTTLRQSLNDTQTVYSPYGKVVMGTSEDHIAAYILAPKTLVILESEPGVTSDDMNTLIINLEEQ